MLALHAFAWLFPHKQAYRGIFSRGNTRRRIGMSTVQSESHHQEDSGKEDALTAFAGGSSS